MEKLTKKVDIQNCSNASLFFGDFLKERRERKVVLPKVFGVLVKRYYAKQNKNDESYKETNIESIPWKLSKFKSGPSQITGILKCRLVCKAWNQAIEEIHRNEDAGHFYMEFGSNEAVNIRFGRWLGQDRFMRESHVVAFLSHFEASHYDSVGQTPKKCPFFGRFVSVHYDVWYIEHNPTYLVGLMEMLRKFGGEVWYLRLKCQNGLSLENQVSLYQKLKQLVELMPNLKAFRIIFGFPKFSREELQALEEEVQRNPFPKLATLKKISAEGIPAVLCNHLVNRNRQISRLDIKSIDFSGNCAFLNNSLLNLSQLRWKLSSVEDYEAFENCQGFMNLQRFHFDCCCYLPFMPWSRVFNAIESKLNPDSCTELALQMPMPQTTAESMSVLVDSLFCRLRFSNIHRVKIQSYARFCVDFLLSSKNSLKYIRLDCDLKRDDPEQENLRDKQIIEFYGYEGNMQSSNIAKELPRLRNLKVWIRGRSFQSYFIEPDRVVKIGEE